MSIEYQNIEKFCNTNNLKYISKLNEQNIYFFLKVIPITLRKYSDSDNIYRKRAIQILDLLYQPQYISQNCSIQGLRNIKSSCYLDSVLLALFVTPNDFISNVILNSELQPISKIICRNKNIVDNTPEIDLLNRQKIQKQLRLIADSIQNKNKKTVKYCTNLRKVFKDCPNPENYHLGGEKDAGEFLTYILSIFDINSAKKEIITYGTNDLQTNSNLTLVSKIIDDRSSIINFIDSFKLEENKKNINYINDFLSQINHSGVLENYLFKRTIQITTLISTPYLIFNFQRINHITNKFMKTKIIPTQTLTIQDGSRFQLSAIVVWLQNHYTTFFKCNENWYYHNDLFNSIKNIGNFQKLLEQKNPSPITNGILYFYTYIYSI